ncbi:voltage-dependent calcium channel beta subunit-associated regulatory protein-like [Acipenser ruthenus]|uniref:voltage-dependent calcium channel beta subunit-associated regulatory protein-like n=1 Tax=Acipenser ruthenus TaxID=7906 RepID=UPI00145A3824|nr:voltage-dependent calcium channel beta subunit-associated regulatory protein-like [Acipenser ruthenus]XP_058870228.1 voltage-dependent calcium channel beta subunit-associated regulatory protein-like [Acipenser ruthenus]
MSNELPGWKYRTENTTDVPKDPGKQDGYVLLLVLLSVFIGGMVVLLSGLLIICRHWCVGGRRYSRASDDPEKTNTTYLEDSQPAQDITIKVDESDCLSTSSYHDIETDRFLSTCSTGRRVSFNEAALFYHSKKTQEKGRRYTLTEGDFHHLKNARLIHLNIPPPSLKIVTIHESSENNIAMATRPASKSSLSIFQPPMCALPQTALTSLSLSSSSALPGDTFNSTVDTSFMESVPAPLSEQTAGSTMEVFRGSARNGGSPVSSVDGSAAVEGAGTAGSALPSSSSAGIAGGQGTVLQFFTKLRRHASLESASPYFKIKKWKFDGNQRASSLDTRGSPRRRQFQRQRAASESMDQQDRDAHHIEVIQYIARTDDVAFCPTPASTFLPPPSTPPPSLGRLEAAEVEVEVEVEVAAGSSGGVTLPPEEGESSCGQESSEHHTLYRDIWNLRASLEQYASSDQSSNDKDSVRSETESVCSLGGGERGPGLLPSYPSQDIGDDLEGEAEQPGGGSFGKEGAATGGAKQGSVDSERSSDGESGNRKLLQMDSGYASIEAPSRAPEELRLFGAAGGTREKTASEKRRFFTSSGRKGTVCESFDEELEGASLEVESPVGWSPYGQVFQEHPPHHLVLRRRDYSIDEKTDALFHEFLRHDPQFDHPESPLRLKHRSRVHLRKQWQRTKQYSDPGVRFPPSFERHRTPLRRGDSVNYPLDTRYHSTLPRIVSAADEESSDGAASGVAPEEKTNPSGSSSRTIKEEEETLLLSPPLSPGVISEHPELPKASNQAPVSAGNGGSGGSHFHSPFSEPPQEDRPPPPLQPPGMGYGPQTISAELTDKLTASLDDRLYTSLRRAKESPECVVTITHASPDHSPV